MTATGLQIAILLALVQFAIAILAYYLERAMGWSKDQSFALGNSLFFSIALLLFLTVAPLRRHLRRLLSTPVPVGLRAEVVVVSVAKVAIPFAVLGALFLYFQIEGGTADLYGKLPLATDAAAIERRYYTTIGLLYAVVITMIAAPIVEEIVFRGFLYGAWEREWGWIRAMLATSLCFALAHPGAMIRTFLGSVVFVCLLRRTGSLWSPICAHMIYNTLVTWPLLGHVIVVRSHDGIERAESWILEFVCLAFVVVALPIYVWIARTKRTPEAP